MGDMNSQIEVSFSPEAHANMNKDSFAQENKKLWRVSSFDTAECALIEGLGYGWLPKHRVENALKSGKLKILPLEDNNQYKSNFYLIHGRTSMPQFQVTRLVEVMVSTVAEISASAR
jgi:DNA-binding transcriptional LysR family regulator